MNFLFVCSRNQWRSPTAERVISEYAGIHTRSAGTSRHAKHTISKQDVLWADVIMVMEYHHKKQIMMSFRKELHHKTVIVLDIPDDYHYMDVALIELIHESVAPYLP